MEEDFTQCAEIVRRADQNRYLTALLADLEHRRPLMALYAFYNEIARVLDAATEPSLAAIRFQWWRDELAALRERAAHPALAGLGQAVARGELSRSELLQFIEAREAELAGRVIHTWEDLDAYCDRTAGRLISTSLKLLGAGERHMSLAENAGRAWGLMGLVRAFPHHAGQGRIYLPSEAFTDVGLDPDNVFRGEGGAPVMGILLAAIGRAQDYLTLVRQGARGLPKQARPAIAYLSFIDLYAEQIRLNPSSPFALHPEIPAFRKQWRLFTASLSGGV